MFPGLPIHVVESYLFFGNLDFLHFSVNTLQSNSIHEGAINLGNLHYGFIVVPAASNYIYPSTMCILKYSSQCCVHLILFIADLFTNGNQEPKIPDFLIASTTMTKDSALGDSNFINLHWAKSVSFLMLNYE